jgi:transposase
MPPLCPKRVKGAADVDGTERCWGVDTHADFHVAAAVDHNGGLLGVESFPADEAGLEELVGWLAAFGPVGKIGVEGTGSWGVGLSRFLGELDIETDAPDSSSINESNELEG